MNELYGYTKKEKIKRIILILAIVVLVIFGIIVYSNQKYEGILNSKMVSNNIKDDRDVKTK